MVEIVFSDSACGGLKAAQHWGRGEYQNGTMQVFLCSSDGSAPTEEDRLAAQQEADRQMQAQWESGIPMGGNPEDVYGFHYGLSIGDISEPIPGEKRRQVLEWLYSVYPDLDDGPAFTAEMMAAGRTVLEEICGRISTGEQTRIWYSSQPDELCALYWFMAQICELDLQDGQILLVALPEGISCEDDSMQKNAGWAGVRPGDWYRYLDGQKAATPAFCKSCAAEWEQLRKENAPLRAVLNGRLVGMPETLYDQFILRELEAAADEFDEAVIVGKVLVNYELGIGDAWIAQRIEKMIAEGSLMPVTNPAPDSPIYHRRLKKCTQNKHN